MKIFQVEDSDSNLRMDIIHQEPEKNDEANITEINDNIEKGNTLNATEVAVSEPQTLPLDMNEYPSSANENITDVSTDANNLNENQIVQKSQADDALKAQEQTEKIESINDTTEPEVNSVISVKEFTVEDTTDTLTAQSQSQENVQDNGEISIPYLANTTTPSKFADEKFSSEAAETNSSSKEINPVDVKENSNAVISEGENIESIETQNPLIESNVELQVPEEFLNENTNPASSLASVILHDQEEVLIRSNTPPNIDQTIDAGMLDYVDNLPEKPEAIEHEEKLVQESNAESIIQEAEVRITDQSNSENLKKEEQNESLEDDTIKKRSSIKQINVEQSIADALAGTRGIDTVPKTGISQVLIDNAYNTLNSLVENSIPYIIPKPHDKLYGSRSARKEREVVTLPDIVPRRYSVVDHSPDSLQRNSLVTGKTASRRQSKVFMETPRGESAIEHHSGIISSKTASRRQSRAFMESSRRESTIEQLSGSNRPLSIEENKIQNRNASIKVEKFESKHPSSQTPIKHSESRNSKTKTTVPSLEIEFSTESQKDLVKRGKRRTILTNHGFVLDGFNLINIVIPNTAEDTNQNNVLSTPSGNADPHWQSLTSRETSAWLKNKYKFINPQNLSLKKFPGQTDDQQKLIRISPNDNFIGRNTQPIPRSRTNLIIQSQKNASNRHKLVNELRAQRENALQEMYLGTTCSTRPFNHLKGHDRKIIQDIHVVDYKSITTVIANGCISQSLVSTVNTTRPCHETFMVLGKIGPVESLLVEKRVSTAKQEKIKFKRNFVIGHQTRRLLPLRIMPDENAHKVIHLVQYSPTFHEK